MEEILFIDWICRIVKAFILYKEEFRVVGNQACHHGTLPVKAKKLVAEFNERGQSRRSMAATRRDVRGLGLLTFKGR
jgi:hypothetical protein